MAPGPFAGAPVEDRSLRRAPPPPVAKAPPPPPVEVNPLERPEPFTPRDFASPVVPEPFSAPSPPAAPTTPQPSAPAVEQPPTDISRQGNPAVVALLDSAADYVSSGELEKAAASLERALRIEPKNASIWHDLGQIRLHQRQYEQAESLAAKSNSLAGNNDSLRIRNWRLIAAARRAMGDATGADAAEAQAVMVERGG